MEVRPFLAALADRARVARISVPAFDAMTVEGRREIRMLEPMSWLHAMQSVEDAGSVEAAVEASATEFARLLADGAFVERSQPEMYVYRMGTDGWTQSAIVADVPVTSYSDGTILPHEKVHRGDVDRLVAYLRGVGVASSPVSATYRANDEIRQIIEHVSAMEPLLDFVSLDGLHQEIWAIPTAQAARVVQVFAGVEVAYITDGHHRSAAAAEYARSSSADSPSAHILTALFGDDQLRIVEFNRIVPYIDNATSLQHALADWGAIPVARHEAHPRAQGELGVWVRGFWYRVTLPSLPGAVPPESLDPAVLQTELLGPVLGLEPSELEYVPGSVGLVDVEHRAREGAVFLLHALTVADMVAVADAGKTMPPKSTYFEPKVRSGIFVTKR